MTAAVFPPMTLGTVGDHRLIGTCDACGYYRDLDVPALVARLGPDMPVPDIGARLRCSRCGHRGGSVVVSGPRR